MTANTRLTAIAGTLAVLAILAAVFLTRSGGDDPSLDPEAGGRGSALLDPENPAPRSSASRHQGGPAIQEIAPGSLRGRVVAADGGAVAAAQFRLRGPQSYRVEVSTDSEGRFEIAEVPAERSLDWELEAADLAPRFQEGLVLAAGEQRDLGDLELDGGRKLEGRVVAETGRPIADAQVFLVAQRGPRSRLELDMFEVFRQVFNVEQPLAATRTDAEGRFRFDRVTRGEWVVAAFAVGFQARYGEPMKIAAEGPIPPQTLELAAGVELTGRVIDERGEPVEGALIAVLAEKNRRDLVLKTMKTDSAADGSFRFDALGAEPQVLFVRHEGYPDASVRSVIPGTPAEIVLRPGARITGRAFDRETGLGLAGLRIALVGIRSPAFAEAQTDAEGRYAILDAPPTEKAVLLLDSRRHVIDLEGVDAQASWMGGMPLPGPLEAGADLKLDLPLHRRASIAGRVVDRDDGRGLAGARVRAWSKIELERGIGARPCETRSGADGVFLLEGVPSGEVIVRAEHADKIDDGRGRLEQALAPGEARTGLLLHLSPGVHLRGRVEGADGRPVPWPRIVARVERPAVEGAEGDPSSLPLETLPIEGEGDDEGRFDLGPVPRDVGVLLLALHPEFPVQEPASLTVAEADIEDIVLKVGRGATITGHAFLPDGRPATGILLTWNRVRSDPTANPRERLRLDTVIGRARVETDGSFRFRGLPLGEGRFGLGPAPEIFIVTPAGQTSFELPPDQPTFRLEEGMELDLRVDLQTAQR